MKTIKNILLAGAMLFMAVLFTGCDKKFDTPGPERLVTKSPTMTIKELKALYKGGPTEIREDIVIEGKVVSTDRFGNIYRIIYIQDETSGIEVKIGKTGLYNYYREGQTVYVNAKGLFLGAYGGFISIGAQSAQAKYENDYMDADLLINQSVERGNYGAKVTPKVINNISELTDDMMGMLVTVKNLTYSPAATDKDTWATPQDVEEGVAAITQNQTFKQGSLSLVVRTSGYAKFAGDKMPQTGTEVDITAIYTKFGTTGQLILNSVADVVVVR